MKISKCWPWEQKLSLFLNKSIKITQHTYEYFVSLFSLSSSRDDRFHLGEGFYLKNKITTALIGFFCDLGVPL
jgi:hypothetical protein